MQINFATEILDLDGTPIKDAGKNLTLRSAACGALTAPFPEDQNAEATVKVSRYRLALKASEGGTQDWPVEDVAEMKRLIGKAYGPLIVGRCFDAIEPPKPEAPAAE